MASFNNVLYDISNNNYNVFEPIFIDGLNTIPMSGKKYYNNLFDNLMCAFAVDNGDSIFGGNAIIAGDLNSCANVYINRTLTVSGYIFNQAIINSLTPLNALVNKLYVDSLSQSYINNITIGTVTTSAAGTSASITQTGIAPNTILNFTIPSGSIGATGPSGSIGATGPSGSIGATGSNGSNGTNATITVGTTTTGAVGTSASVSNVGTSAAAILNFTIPVGATGVSSSLIDYATLAGPTVFSCTPSCVNASSGDSSTKIATTAFVKNQGYAPLSGANIWTNTNTFGKIGQTSCVGTYMNTQFRDVASLQNISSSYGTGIKTRYQNMAIGTSTLPALTTGFMNVAFGTYSMQPDMITRHLVLILFIRLMMVVTIPR